MWAILIAILLCAQNFINGKNRLENAKSKFHAQNQSVSLTGKINQPINRAITLGKSNLTIDTYEINFTTHSSDHNSQEANAITSFWPQQIEISTKNSKKCISISADNDLTSGFFPVAANIMNKCKKLEKLSSHPFPSSMKNGLVGEKSVGKWTENNKTRIFATQTKNILTQARKSTKFSTRETTANFATTQIDGTRHATEIKASPRSHREGELEQKGRIHPLLKKTTTNEYFP